MAEIRLNKIIRTYNIGLQNLVDFLISKGVEVEANPNAKISDDLLPQIEKQFGKDLELKQASEKVDIKLNEILEKTSRKQQENAKEEEDEEPVRETVIKTTIFTPVEQRQEAAQAPQPEVAPEPKDDAQPERETAPSPEPETRTAEEAPAKEAEPEVCQEPEPVKEVPAKWKRKPRR